MNYIGNRNAALIISALSILVACVAHDINKTTDCSASTLSIQLDSVINASACNQADGVLFVSGREGERPYSFSVNHGPYQEDSVFHFTAPGLYTLGVRDGKGCESVINNVAVMAQNFQFSSVITSDTECVNHNGSISLEVKASTGPFQYKLNHGDFIDQNAFASLKTGVYQVTVKDNTDCTVQFTVQVPKGHTSASWSSDILPIMKTSCAVTGCHDGKTRTDYRNYANASGQATSIKSQTQSRSMPFDGTPLTLAEIELIGCWVDDGALNN